jgi:hypothetical protein
LSVPQRADLTEDTLAAIDEFAPEYQELIRSERRPGPAALLGATGLDPNDLDED